MLFEFDSLTRGNVKYAKYLYSTSRYILFVTNTRFQSVTLVAIYYRNKYSSYQKQLVCKILCAKYLAKLTTLNDRYISIKKFLKFFVKNHQCR